MEELKNEIEQAYTLISSMPARGDAIEVVAGIRQHLRNAYKLARDGADQREDNDG